MFVGVHERQLDDKGRLAFPVAFRHLLGDRCYLVFGDDQCVNVFATADFERMAADAIEQVRQGAMTLNRQRALAHSATLVTIDKQGRVTIDEKLRDFARLAPGSKVVVSGNFTRAELWSEDLYARIDASGRDELAGSSSSSSSSFTPPAQPGTPPAQPGTPPAQPGERRTEEPANDIGAP